MSHQINTSAAAPQAGEGAILAKRYARALFALADERQAVAEIAIEMDGLQQLAAQSEELRQLITDPRFTRANLGQALQKLAAMAGLSKITADFLGLLAKNRRAGLLPQIAAAFLAERARRDGEITAAVTSAQPLTETQQKQLIEKLAAATGSKIRLSLHQDPDLIGGFTVKWGSQLIDASLKGRLAALKHHMKQEAA
ncbi:MAG: F0F1 ATP synthase subunit delta [Alphaproteobacteria bacterium]